MAKSMIILVVAMIALQQLIACQAAELGEQKKEAASADDKGLMPVIVLKQSESKEDKPDFFLIWIKPYEQFMPDQVKDMLDSRVRPQTQQMSEQISNIPGSEQAYQMISQAQEAMASMMSGAGSGGSNPLSGMFGRRR